MADDQTQRPHSTNETLARSAPARPPGMTPGMAPRPASSSDPLAELARLIGQNDPFSEHGQRRPAAPAGNWVAPPAGNGYAPPPVAHEAPPPMPQQYGAQNFARPSYGSAPLAPGGNRYRAERDDPRYPDAQHSEHAAGYDDEEYPPSKPNLAQEEVDFYEDEPSGRRRMGVLVIAGILALAVIGTAGAFGYRALFGSPSSSPPPVIKADSGPIKIVPASNRDPQSSKQITDRVNDRGMGEKLVSREEQPVEIKDKPAGVMFPLGQNSAQSAQPQLGSGVVGSDPKRVRTIAIRPDQGTAAAADAAPASTPARATAVAPPPVRQAAAPPPPRVVSNPPPAAEPEPPAPAPRQAVARAAPPVQQQAAAPASGNAPLSLSPDAPARAAPARASAPPPPVRTAAVTPAQPAPAPAAATGATAGYAVQVSSQRSEAEAQAAFRSLQAKYPGQLGGKQPLIRQVDLGAKGIYFRAMVGPFANGSEASELCGSLKAAGGQCIIQRN